MNNCRYRLQHKQSYVMPNILGGRSFPVYTYKWVDIAVSDDKTKLEEYAGELLKTKLYRIEDTYANLQS